MPGTNPASWPQVVRRSTALLVMLVALLGLATTGFVLWNKDRSARSHSVINDFHLASAFKTASAREEIGHLLGIVDAELRGAEPASESRWSDFAHSDSLSASIHVVQQRIAEVLEIQRRFSDPRFDGIAARLEQRSSDLAGDVEAMPAPDTVSLSVFENLDSLATILTQLERLHTITYDELLVKHAEDETRDTGAFVAFVLTVVLIGYLAIRRWLFAIDNLVASQRRAEEEQKKSDVRFRSAFENVSVGNVIFSDRGIIETCNSAAQEIFGYPKNEVAGLNIKDLIAEADWSHIDGPIEKLSEANGEGAAGAGMELSGVRKNGQSFPMHLVVAEMPTDDAKLFVGSVTDLSDIKALEQQLFRSQRLEAVGQLTGGVAHDFNNVMTTILGNAESLMEAAREDETARRLSAAILRAVDRGASLTQRLLAFSRQQVLFPVPSNVCDLIDGLTDMLRRTLGETIDLKVQCGSGPWLAHIDPNQFENALINLVLNARDAMPEGGGLTIATRNVTVENTQPQSVADLAPGDYVAVSVSDDGAGMSAETLEKAFEPFFTTKEVGKGSGLGLSMVYGFARQSQGHIAIDSALGEGTTAELFLPRSSGQPVGETTTDVETTFQRGKGRILVVEDDAQVREIATGILRNQGYEVVEAGDHTEASKILSGGPPVDLLFTDVVLPGGMNGVEIAKLAKRMHPQIKILYTSGYTENAAMNADGFDPKSDLVNKPYRRNELLEKVRLVLGGKPTPRVASSDLGAAKDRVQG